MELNFQSADEAQRWADDWVASHRFSEVLKNIDLQQEKNLAHFESDYGRFVGQFECQYSALIELIDAINFTNKSSWPPHRAVQYVLVSYNLTPMISALNRLKHGFYEDALTLIRGSYETFVRLMFISCYPTDFWGVFRQPPSGVRTFNLTNFLSDELKLGWSHYSILSAFAHSNSFKVATALEKATEMIGERERFRLNLEYDPEMIELVVPLLQFVLLTYLRFAVECLNEPVVQNVNTSQVADEARAFLIYCFRNHEKPHWHQVVHDLDFLFKMIQIAEAGGDWRQLVATRTT